MVFSFFSDEPHPFCRQHSNTHSRTDIVSDAVLKRALLTRQFSIWAAAFALFGAVDPQHREHHHSQANVCHEG